MKRRTINSPEFASMIFRRFDELEEKLSRPETGPPKLMTQRELASYLGVTPETIINNHLPTLSIGRRVLYDLERVLKYIERK